MKHLLISAAAVLLCMNALAWEAAGDKIKTKWAAEVKPSEALPEYPRPQMVRADWESLNGLWDYAITPEESDYSRPDGKILVPFCVESSLSGVQREVGDKNALWYVRSFSVPSDWRKGDVMLNFGAVDWKAEVWINGHKAGEHTGGYAPFSLNITPYLNKSASQTIRVKVWDGTDAAYQPRGKQYQNPHGIFYTSVSGIWQSVWIEPVSHEARIVSYNSIADIENGILRIHVKTEGSVNRDEVKVELLEGGTGYDPETPSNAVIACENGKHVDFSTESLKYWSPESPWLYGLKISIVRNGKVIDCVNGYTAVRQVTDVRYPVGDRNVNSYHRFFLNGAPTFMFGPLDQGWWPDGLYTAPTDEALKFDIVKTKEMGFNMIRKHVKVEPARWYYWCDVLGIMVWQDMPSAGDNGDEECRSKEVKENLHNKWSSDSFLGGTDCNMPQQWKNNFYKEWGEIIDALKSFPCIVVWVPFNEAWAQFDTPEVVKFTRSKDSSRLINESSGGNYHFSGDIIDAHHYPCPAMNIFESGFINVLGEYGGIGCPVEGHLWNPENSWGYNKLKEGGDQVLELYGKFAEMLKVFIGTGCSAAVYTQTTDVESEINGLMTYDRLMKVDVVKIREINRSVIESLK